MHDRLRAAAQSRAAAAYREAYDEHPETAAELRRAEQSARRIVANFDDLASVPRSRLVRRLGSLGARSGDLCEALRAMADC